MTSAENNDESPVAEPDAPTTENADTVGNQDNNSVDEPVTDKPSFTEDEPYLTEVGDRVWVNDGKTYRQTRDESVYVTDGDHTETVRALTELGY